MVVVMLHLVLVVERRDNILNAAGPPRERLAAQGNPGAPSALTSPGRIRILCGLPEEGWSRADPEQSKESAVISASMPVYARADVAFSRGEGAYLYADDGRRYLDFGAGIAVVSLGHCHPRIVEALKDQAGKLWPHLEPLSHPRPGAPGRAAGGQLVRGLGVLRQFRCRGNGIRPQDDPQVPRRDGQSRALPGHLLRRSLPRPDAGDHRRQRPGQTAQGIRAGRRRIRPRRLRQPQRDACRHHRRDRRHPGGTRAGRGRHAPRRPRVPAGPEPRSPTSLACS